MTMPDRIWADAPECFDDCGIWNATPQDGATEYVPANLVQPDPRDEVIARLVEAAELADAAMRGASMNMYVVESKISAAIAAAKAVLK